MRSVPNNPFREYRLQNEAPAENPFRAYREREAAAVTTSPLQAGLRKAATEYSNMALAFPRGIGNLIAGGAAGASAIAAKMRGEPAEFGERFAEEQGKLPASALRAIPAPTVQGMAAGIRSIPALVPGGESFGDAFARNREAITAEEEALAAAHPVATAIGGVGGDVAAIISGRLPFARRIGEAEKALAGGAPQLYFGAAAPAAQSNLGYVLDKTVLSPAMRRLARGAGRSVEAGLEAAVLDTMKGDDPLETAYMAAIGQAGASGAIELGKTVWRHPSLAMAGLAMASTFQIMKEATPGGRDRILESVESGFQKVTWTLAASVAAGAVGGGRLRGTEFAQRFPKLADSISTIPRAAVISMAQEWTKASPEEQSQMEMVASRLASDPGYFGPNVARRLDRAAKNGTLFDEVDRLQKTSAQFRKQMEAIEKSYRTGGGF